MPQIKSNFVLRSSEPNFERDRYMTLESMGAVTKNELDEGHIVYCVQTGKHYIFNQGKHNTNLDPIGLFREFELHDTIIVKDYDELSNYEAIETLPIGRLVYCEFDKQIYYNVGTFVGDEAGCHGWFKPIINMQDSNYVSMESEEWKDLNDLVEDLSNASMLAFDTIKEMAEFEPSNYMNEGQLAYCKELNRHFYLPKNNGEYVKNGYYGYFRIVCDEVDEKPVITQPSIYVEVEYNENSYKENGWELVNIDGKNILMITDGSTIPNIKAVKTSVYRGEIDYNNFPYYEGDSKIVSYIGDEDYVTDMYLPTDKSILYGDNEFFVSAKVSGGIPTPTDINGIEREEMKWDSTKAIESNPIIVNKTKYWKATTDKGLVNQPLIPWSQEMIGYAKLLPTCQCNQQIEIPEGRELKGLFIKGLAGYVDDYDEWNRIGNKWTYRGSHRGEVEIKIIF